MADPGLVPGIVVFLLLSLLGAGIVFSTVRHRDRLQFQLQLFLIAFVLRFALSVVIYQFGFVSVVGDEDASGWRVGTGLHWNWTHSGVTLLDLPFQMSRAFEETNQGYRYLLGAFFFITDSPVRLVAAAMNCFFGALTVLFAYRTARSIFSDWVAEKVAWWTCLFPSMLIWSAMTVKEPVVIFLETVALYACTRLRQDGVSVPHMVLAAATIVLLMPFRFYASYLVGAAVLLSLLAPALFQPKSGAAALSLAALVLPLILSTGWYARHEASFRSFDLDRVQEIRSFSAGNNQTGTDSGVSTGDVRSYNGLAYGMTIGAAHLLLAPFPWQLGGGSLRMVLTLPELVYWWWLVSYGLIPGVIYSIRNRLADVRGMLLMLIGFGLLYSLTFGNVGLVFRQRAQLLPWMFILAAVGLEQRALRRMQGLPQIPGQDGAYAVPYGGPAASSPIR
ncbi:MAG: hypothetical protein ACO1SX_18120 [Actinomycetota bacterium]